MGSRFVDQFFSENKAPPEVDVAAIRGEWSAVQMGYAIADRHLPLPVWARRPLTENEEEAWQILRSEVPLIDPAKPLSIYIHVPFCAERCHFCDCYAFRLTSYRERHVSRYVDLLGREMGLWSQLGTLISRPVSTVHFGGGTPTSLGVKPFERLIRSCQEYISSPATEWALESTATELSLEMLQRLSAWGFRRLHIGVQSLQDEIRQLLNRRAMAKRVLKVIADAISMGWIVSVDLIYGLPSQTLDGFLDDIRSLVVAGVDGFSLYELQLSRRNRSFARRHGLERRDRHTNYLMAQVASRLLVALGYEKTLFNHFAGDEDTNLYFTFPERNEDLLALGTIADGVFGDYHYRHREYAAYGRSVDAHLPGLEGGLRKNDVEHRLQPLITALMASRVRPSRFVETEMESLLDSWRELLLLEEDPQTGELCLTGSGSWFVGNMIQQLLVYAKTREGQGTRYG
jgi:oxygen-independent coproporphyrinogen-3 oxidase